MEDDKIIDYCLLSEFINFFKEIGFKEINVPWLVEKKYQEITFPELLNLIGNKEKYLIGSAEQSFIKLDLEKKLPLGKYFAITPCFRFGDLGKTEYHQDYFLKLEIYISEKIKIEQALDIINLIQEKYNQYLPTKIIEKKEKNTILSYDIISKNDIELGSYGIRTYKDIVWFYGTGLALPRFSQAVNKIKATK